MAVAFDGREHSLQGLVRRYWTAFTKTVIGDVIATVIAITGISALFLAGSFGVIWLTRIATAIWNLLG
ncbi:MAG TPA: hypothetical protein VKR31_12830 [Rhizomicrobium sp.]|nr:hypothetical protein [Rhizomicrobium sp.]